MTNGFSKSDGVLIGSPTVQQVCEDYAKARLCWRVSHPQSNKCSLGWIPFKARALRYKAGKIVFVGQCVPLWDSYDQDDHELVAGIFSQDSRGRWYLNVVVKVQAKTSAGTAIVGIDLGLKEAAVTCTGARIEGRFHQMLEAQFGIGQQAHKKTRVKAIHAKIAHQRKDMLHKSSSALARKNVAIFVGDVASTKLVKTKMVKNTLDAGWAMLRAMLEYKSHRASIVFEVVDESYAAQTCSCSGAIPASSPKDKAGLRIREWNCRECCGMLRNQGTNAAKNIDSVGYHLLAAGILVL